MHPAPNIASAAPNAASLANSTNTITAAGHYSGPALAAIAGQAAAASVIKRLRDGTAQPDDLVALLCDLGPDELAGACSAIAKALATPIES